MILEGAIIELLNGPFDGVRRLVDVLYKGETIIMMFTNDMEHHNETVVQPAA